ncbi:TetR/AcrR family transcriptional regulator [Pseudofrankia inefficax]|uniref:Regulatory protein TetR n=1 Tax=Pseudofrankia inefficax (strain DSM 45817 / CECT 9037 / DDB 130130 / EuI1c) TaxID=298654 RepID=E3IWG7_PSEI1|nr:regulatory protein TetR [Pseudofrankia inefficax]
MRSHGWGGNPPATDKEARERILDATRRCIDVATGAVGIVAVAEDLGVTRQTIYRYFPSTVELLQAAMLSSVEPFLDRLSAELGQLRMAPADLVIEALVTTLDSLLDEPYLALVFEPGRGSAFSRGVTSPNSRAFGRAILDRLPLDWAAEGFTEEYMDELVEHTLRIFQSFVLDPGSPPRRGDDLRRYLRRWLAPTITPSECADRSGARAPERS